MRIASGIVVPRSAPCFTFSFLSPVRAAGGGVALAQVEL